MFAGRPPRGVCVTRNRIIVSSSQIWESLGEGTKKYIGSSPFFHFGGSENIQKARERTARNRGRDPWPYSFPSLFPSLPKLLFTLKLKNFLLFW